MHSESLELHNILWLLMMIFHRIKVRHAHGTNPTDNAGMKARREGLANKVERFEQQSEKFLRPVVNEDEENESDSEEQSFPVQKGHPSSGFFFFNLCCQADYTVYYQTRETGGPNRSPRERPLCQSLHTLNQLTWCWMRILKIC